MQRAKITRTAGFTIVELMVVVAIVAIVLTLVAPSFKSLIEMQRLRSINDQLVTDFQFARAEAARLGLGVHFITRPATAVIPACYIIYSDKNFKPTTWSTACDCRAAAGSRCSSTNTAEIKTVQMILEHKILLKVVPGIDSHVAFDPATGILMVPAGDEGDIPPSPYKIDTKLDNSRSLRTILEISGRPSVCAPSGSAINVQAC